MIQVNYPRWMRFLVAWSKKVGIFLALLWSGYKQWDLSAKAEELENDNIELREVISDVVVKIANDTYDINDIPFPMWYKIYVQHDETFRMVKLNKAYREKYNISNVTYFGKSDKAVTAAGVIYESNDRRVLESAVGEVVYVYEPYTNQDGTQSVGKYAKWKVERNGNTYIYGMEVE